MRILVFEFITGGGLIGTTLPASLMLEGGMMRNALLADLASIPDVEVTLTRDSRCPWPETTFPTRRIESNDGESGFDLFQRALVDVEIVWPIAPETGGVLAQLATLARMAGKLVCLSDPETLAICESKYETASVLRDACVNVVPSFRATDSLPPIDGQWVSKPDDGAGGDGIRRWPTRDAALQAILAAKQYSWILQPMCDGESLSMSLFCADGTAYLVSINQQRVLWRQDHVFLDELTVNSIPNTEADFCALAKQIVQALPGLWGYVGVDLVRSDDGVLTVLEINSRLTTSYCGLRDALGVNVAQLMLGNRKGEPPRAMTFPKSKLVQLDLSSSYAG